MTTKQIGTPLRKHTKLSNFLLSRFGTTESQGWWAQQTFVSQAAVSSWLTGKCRPMPDRLGLIAAILGLSEDEVDELAEMAEYNESSRTITKSYLPHIGSGRQSACNEGGEPCEP